MRNKGKMRIELPLAIIDYKPEGFIHVHYKRHSFTLDETEEIFKHVRDFSPWEVCPLLMSNEDFTEHTKESQSFLTSEKITQHFSAIGFITKNIAQKIIANFFKNIYKKEVQSRFFIKDEDAITWFSKFEKKRKKEIEKPALVLAK